MGFTQIPINKEINTYGTQTKPYYEAAKNER